jgi:hypothetical protein
MNKRPNHPTETPACHSAVGLRLTVRYSAVGSTTDLPSVPRRQVPTTRRVLSLQGARETRHGGYIGLQHDTAAHKGSIGLKPGRCVVLAHRGEYCVGGFRRVRGRQVPRRCMQGTV